MLLTIRTGLGVTLALGMTCAAVAGETPAVPAPANEAAAPGAPAADKLTVTIHSVEGDVDVRKPAGEWAAANAGQVIEEGWEISTGFKSKAVLLFGDTSVAIVKPLTQLTINRFVKREKTAETLLDVKIGTLRVHVKEGELKSDFKVSTPQLTASVRGTIWQISSSRSCGDRISGYQGRVVAQNFQGMNRSVGAGERTDNALARTIETMQLQRLFSVLPVAGLTTNETSNTGARSDQGASSPGDLTDTASPGTTHASGGGAGATEGGTARNIKGCVVP
ncbi:MAG: FecR domain-containing protein [Planctomycetota bacterium]